MARVKTIKFEDSGDSHEPFIPSSASNIEMIGNGKPHYCSTNKTEEVQMESNYSTVSSTVTYPKDTVVLLNSQHQEDDIHQRSIKATLCMVFAMLIILGLIGMAFASLHYKLTKNHTELQLKNSTLPEIEGHGLNLNNAVTENKELSQNDNTTLTPGTLFYRSNDKD